MTSQKDQIQSLIADIDQVLSAQKPRKPWIRASEVEPQRQALAKAQDYLRSLQQTLDAPGGWGPIDPSTGQIGVFSGLPVANQAAQGGSQGSSPAAGAADSSPEDVLQALLTEMKYLKSSALEPLRLEMDSLRAQRDRLQQDVKELADQRSSLSVAEGAGEMGLAGSVGAGRLVVDETQLNQFLAALMERLQERLAGEVTQTLGQLESDHAAAIAKLSASADTEVLQLRPSIPPGISQEGTQLEAMRELQSRSDQLLLNIESTLQGMFETLQKNIDSYQISLNDGIENMHSLGLQGEVIVRSLVDHLTQQLGQTAPPEPAFFPPRSADSIDLPLVFADESDPDGDGSVDAAGDALTDSDFAVEAGDATDAPLEAPDTVASLDEILPVASEEVLAEEVLAEEASVVIAEAAELQPEDCIQEDGTIDLDLLKLDIDRDNDSESLTTDELMVDAAAADAEVAAAEAEDAEIAAKVVPTPEAAYLAGLTLEDLTVGETQDASGDEWDEASERAVIAEEPVDGPVDELIDGLEDESTEVARQSAFQADDVELAAILPDLGERIEDSEAPEALDPYADFSELEEENGDDDVYIGGISAAALGAAALGVGALGGADGGDAQDEHDTSDTSGTDENWDAESEPLFRELEAILDEDAVTGSDESVGTDAVGTGEVEADKSEAGFVLPESALLPDIPDEDDELEDVSGRSLAPEDAVDDTVSDELAADLEAQNQASVQLAASAVTRGLAALSANLNADLEEPVVSEAAITPPSALAADASPLDSALIPDWPEAGANEESRGLADGETSEGDPEPNAQSGTQADSQSPQFLDADPFDEMAADDPDALSPIELPADLTTDLPADLTTESPTELPAAEPPAGGLIDPPLADLATFPLPAAPTDLPPSDFDDDLDFYSTEDTAADTTTDEMLASLSTESFDEEEAMGESLPLLEAPMGISEDFSGEGYSDTDLIDDDYNDDYLNADNDPSGGQPASWFLGIDIGTTGLSAVLINQLGDQVYPLCWNVPGDEAANRFRLPAVLSVDSQVPGKVGEVGPVALQQSDRLLRNIKSFLKVGIPSSDSGAPFIQWSDRQALPLLSLQGAMTDLLKTLSAPRTSAQVVGLSDGSLRWVLAHLQGVIVGYPNNWPDTYSFNVREAVLAAGIVSRPDRVFFVEEAIASLLSALPDPQTASEDLDAQQPGLYNCNWQGGTVAISAGATLSEAAIVDLPEELDQLIYRDFALRSFGYAGDSLDQDIICQLLHPVAQARLDSQAESGSSEETMIADAIDGWQSLGLNKLNLPQAGEADRAQRHRLRQRLNDSPLGREALVQARRLKLVLQEETQCEVTLADQNWVVKRKDLEAKVFLPYIQRVNRQVNGLLSQKGMPAQAIKQVVCTGGSASLGAIARWLRQKFPNATIIQDTYSGEYSNSCSRVAYGLANLCHYPNVLDTHRHQYNDYFLLLELLRVLPDQPLPAGGILHLLEQRGINTQACQSHILALIEGHLPPGLIPTEGDRPTISAQSPNISTYQTLAELPLFRKQGGQIYIADPEQGKRLRAHLEGLLSAKAQELQEPFAVELAAKTV